MSYNERILDCLWAVAPHSATNGQIARALGISSQQTVYMITQELAERRLIHAAKEGATWAFYALDAYADQGTPSNARTVPAAHRSITRATGSPSSASGPAPTSPE
jgi:DNA-binding IclR family transcriptional regulator